MIAVWYLTTFDFKRKRIRICRSDFGLKRSDLPQKILKEGLIARNALENRNKEFRLHFFWISMCVTNHPWTDLEILSSDFSEGTIMKIRNLISVSRLAYLLRWAARQVNCSLYYCIENLNKPTDQFLDSATLRYSRLVKNEAVFEEE